MNYNLIAESEYAWEIKENGTKVYWTEVEIDRDGFEAETLCEGYEYRGKRYTLELDRDGWLWATEV